MRPRRKHYGFGSHQGVTIQDSIIGTLVAGALWVCWQVGAWLAEWVGR